MATNPLTAGTHEVTYQADRETPLCQVIGNRLNTANKNQADADVAQVLTVLPGVFVLLASMKIITAEGAAQTFDLGDGDDVDFYLAEVDGNAAAGTIYTSVNLGTLPSRMYSAADTIDVVSHGAAGVGIYDVRAVQFVLYP